MALLPRPVTIMMFWTPECLASSTPYWINGLSTSGSISLGIALVAGKNRVPSPAAGNTALRTFLIMPLPILAACALRIGFARLGSGFGGRFGEDPLLVENNDIHPPVAGAALFGIVRSERCIVGITRNRNSSPRGVEASGQDLEQCDAARSR